MAAGVFLPGPDTPVHRQCHDQDQAIDTLGRFELGILQAEATTLEVREHRFDGPTRTVVPNRSPVGRAIHCDDPGFGMAALLQDANCDRNACLEQTHVRLVALSHASGQVARGGHAGSTDINQKIALQA